MADFTHHEFGEVVVKRNNLSKRLSFRFNNNDQLVVSAPRLVPLFYIKRSIDDSAKNLRKLRTHRPEQHMYREGDFIGHRRYLRFITAKKPSYKITSDALVITRPHDSQIDEPLVQSYTRSIIEKVYRKDARTYLNTRLKILADRYGFLYQKTRLTNASTRWGSCSSNGTISLNIALMKLPLDLIDYVLIHELCHTKQMNHSTDFWQLVGDILPNYRQLRNEIKRYDTTI